MFFTLLSWIIGRDLKKKKKNPKAYLPTGYNTTYTGYNKIEKYVSRTSLYDEIFMIPIVV